MPEPLWTDRHAPTLAELPQAHLRRYLEAVTGRPVNLLLHGPAGAGKTAAVRALERSRADDGGGELLEINVADFFDRSKSEIESDPRFAHFLDDGRRRSKRDMINRVFRESTAHAPVDGSYRTVLLDNAESVREDFQQSLRRLIERHHETTQFVLTSRQLGRIIPALRSRCLPVPVPAPPPEQVVDRLATILEREAIDFDDDALALLADDADGNLRYAILAAQATHVHATRSDDGAITEEAVVDTIRGVGHGEAIAEMLATAKTGEFVDARDHLDDLLIDAGLEGGELLEGLVTAGRSRLDDQEAGWLTQLAADTDARLATGGDDRVQLSRLLARIATADAD